MSQNQETIRSQESTEVPQDTVNAHPAVEHHLTLLDQPQIHGLDPTDLVLTLLQVEFHPSNPLNPSKAPIQADQNGDQHCPAFHLSHSTALHSLKFLADEAIGLNMPLILLAVELLTILNPALHSHHLNPAITALHLSPTLATNSLETRLTLDLLNPLLWRKTGLRSLTDTPLNTTRMIAMRLAMET